MSINLSDMNFTGGIAMSPQIFSGSLEQQNIGWQYLSINPASTQFDLIGDFTIESWVYPTSSSGLAIFDARVSGASAAPWLVQLADNGGGGKILYFDGSYYYGTNVVPINSWSHVAVVRTGSTLTFYLNGEVDTVTAYTSGSISPGSTSPVVGSKDYSPLAGNISNLRIVVGVAVYTSAFTPSTSPLTAVQPANLNGYPSNAISGNQTVLLLNTDYNGFNFLDRSHNNFTLLNDNMPVPSSVSPFISSDSCSSYFYNTTFNIAATEYGSLFDQDGAFTIECYYYPTEPSYYGYASIWAMNAQFWDCTYDSSPSGETAGKFIFNCPSIGNIVTTDTFTTYNTWYHIALSSDGTTIRAFINGTLQGTFTGTGVVQTSGNPLVIGYAANGPYGYPVIGNLSNFRMVKGVAVYTSAFTPSTNPLTAVQAANVNGSPSAKITGDQTVLLLNTPNNILNHLDSSSYQLITTTPNTPVPSAWNPYNLGSISFNGSSSLQISNSTLFNFDVNDFTIETWAYWSTAKTGNETIFECSGGARLIFGITDTGVRLYTNDGSTGTENGCTYAFSVDTWYHIAVVRLSGNISIYINGVLANTPFADSIVWVFTTETIGGNSDSAEPYTGEISNLRVVNGVAVYSGAFTVPTQPLTVSQIAGTNINSTAPEQTVLLLNTPDSPNNTLDSSIYHLTVTSGGSPAAIVNNPFGPL